MKSPSMPDWRTLHLQRYERCRGGKCDEERRKGLTNATYAACVSVSVCAFIIKPSSAQGERQRDGYIGREGELGLWERSQLQWLLSLTAKFMWLFMHFN